jgi:hypothetical protein
VVLPWEVKRIVSGQMLFTCLACSHKIVGVRFKATSQCHSEAESRN